MSARPAFSLGPSVASGGNVAPDVPTGSRQPDEFLTDQEIAERLRWSEETLRKKVRRGVFTEGLHFHRRRGMTRRWEWDQVVAWMRGESRDEEPGPIIIRLAHGGGKELAG